MAFTSAELEAPQDKMQTLLGVQRFAIAGSGTDTVEVAPAVTGAQTFFKGQISASAATTVIFTSFDGDSTYTTVRSLTFLAAGSAMVRVAATVAGEALHMDSSADVTVTGVIVTLPVAESANIPDNWLLE